MALTPQQARTLQATIDQRRAALLEELRDDLDRLRGRDRYENVAGAVGDRGDESVAALIADLDQADAGRDLNELRALEAARGRLDEGRYGVCAQCERDIGFERLQATPAAVRCIECQTAYEKTHAGPAGSTL